MIDLASLPVLVVDDYLSMRRLLRTLLSQIGLTNVTYAADGAAALAQLRDHSFRLIISDLKMEPVSGLDLLRWVRMDRRLSTIPFIMVTAATDTDQVVAAKKAGVTDYIVKPFTVDILRRKLASVLDLGIRSASLTTE